eukprot:TRINITY_DN34037_c0_g1_i1.p1 TRINITY_DN34037_c0_g1~~TRINITY_DN34037_c0_g1_i1.p1  ORF type:complete len:539 (+),score=79.71 TRINITY_DN34037_c0_g1_i1:56-1618(+)
MSIFVELLSGSQTEIPTVPPDCTVKQLKVMISEYEGISPEFDLTYAGEELADHKKLFGYGVAYGDVVTLEASREEMLRHKIGREAVTKEHLNDILKEGDPVCLDFFTLGYLIDNDDFKPDGGNGFTPIHVLAIHGHTSLLETVITTYSDTIDLEVSRGYFYIHGNHGTVLDVACQNSQVDTVKMLLTKSNVKGKDALASAVRTRNIEIIRLLIDHNRYFVGDSGSVVQAAMETANREIIELVVQAPDLDKTSCYSFACRYTNLETLKWLMGLLKMPLSESSSKTLGPPLHAFCSRLAGTTEILEFVVASGADLNERARLGGLTALHVAARESSIPALRYLMKCDGIEINKRNDYGESATTLALKSCKWQAAEVLLGDERVKVRNVILPDYFPLHASIRENCPMSLVTSLIQKGMSPNSYSPMIKTPLFTACLSGNECAVKALLSFPETDVNLKSGDEAWTPLYMACVANNLSIVKILLSDERVDLNKRTKLGWTALSLAGDGGDKVNIYRELKNAMDERR